MKTTASHLNPGKQIDLLACAATVTRALISVRSPDSLFQLHFFCEASLKMYFKATSLIFLVLMKFSFAKVRQILQYLTIKVY